MAKFKILPPTYILSPLNCYSKKRLFEELSLVVSPLTDMTPRELIYALNQREALGSTICANNIGMPHTLIEELETSIAVLAILPQSISYHTIDSDPEGVDIAFAFFFSPKDDYERYEEILRNLYELFKNPDLGNSLRRSWQDPDKLRLILNKVDAYLEQLLEPVEEAEEVVTEKSSSVLDTLSEIINKFTDKDNDQDKDEDSKDVPAEAAITDSALEVNQAEHQTSQVLQSQMIQTLQTPALDQAYSQVQIQIQTPIPETNQAQSQLNPLTSFEDAVKTVEQINTAQSAQAIQTAQVEQQSVESGVATATDEQAQAESSKEHDKESKTSVLNALTSILTKLTQVDPKDKADAADAESQSWQLGAAKVQTDEYQATRAEQLAATSTISSTSASYELHTAATSGLSKTTGTALGFNNADAYTFGHSYLANLSMASIAISPATTELEPENLFTTLLAGQPNSTESPRHVCTLEASVPVTPSSYATMDQSASDQAIEMSSATPQSQDPSQAGANTAATTATATSAATTAKTPAANSSAATIASNPTSNTASALTPGADADLNAAQNQTPEITSIADSTVQPETTLATASTQPGIAEPSEAQTATELPTLSSSTSVMPAVKIYEEDYGDAIEERHPMGDGHLCLEYGIDNDLDEPIQDPHGLQIREQLGESRPVETSLLKTITGFFKSDDSGKPTAKPSTKEKEALPTAAAPKDSLIAKETAPDIEAAQDLAPTADQETTSNTELSLNSQNSQNEVTDKETR